MLTYLIWSTGAVQSLIRFMVVNIVYSVSIVQSIFCVVYEQTNIHNTGYWNDFHCNFFFINVKLLTFSLRAIPAKFTTPGGGHFKEILMGVLRP